MAIRNTQLVLKNSNIPNKPFSGGTFLQGEAFVNTADGILMFSGNTQSTSEWTPAGTGGNANFFEVGSNLYDLRLRNRLTKYEGVSGVGLTGKFLSGTTNGFVLADISSISGVDTYVTGFTYQDNVFTIKQNVGQPNLTAVINTMTGLSVNGILSATTISGDTIYANSFPQLPYTDGETIEIYTDISGSTFVRLKEIVSAPSGGTRTFLGNINISSGLNVTGNTSLQGLTATTISATTYYNLPLDIYVTGGTYSSDVATFTNNTGGTFTVTGFTTTDTYVTGFTYNPNNNQITLSQNQGQIDKIISINSVSGLTIGNLTQGRVVYVGSGGLLTDESGFTYDTGTNTLSVPTDGTVNVGTGGLNVAGDAVVQGSLTVFGPSVSAFTSNLYVEDPNITLNYNPTGTTTITSVGAGWTIQDGSGIANTATTLNIGVSYLNANLSPNTEYTAATGNENRNLYSPIGDIIIRNTNGDSSAPNGVRLLAENDVLHGGFF